MKHNFLVSRWEIMELTHLSCRIFRSNFPVSDEPKAVDFVEIAGTAAVNSLICALGKV